ncbi:MAG: FkbM family methyltransferase, partial [Magnetococcales bacterium]|nr:FkbM family methyltransferase [Magnetococcales bacterium]
MSILNRLRENIRLVSSTCPGLPDRLKYLSCMYCAKYPWTKWLFGFAWQINFRYPHPVGSLRLLIRNNLGADAFILSEVFHHRYYDLPLPFVPETILDLGANTGLTMIYFSRAYPKARVAGVEPIPENMAVLRENLRLNQVDATLFQSAASVHDGHVEMEIARRDFDHRVLETTHPERFTG